MQYPCGWAGAVLCVVQSGAKTEMWVLVPEMSLVSCAQQKQSGSDARAQLGVSGPSPYMGALTVFRK